METRAQTSGNSNIIDVAHLSFDYPGLRALNNVSFSIRRDGITALVGPNGAGKSTLLRCLAGLDRPLTGSIVINNIDVIEEPRQSHQVLGYLSDFFGLYDDLTVRQNLTYVAAANGVDAARRDALVQETAHDLSLEDRLEQPCAALSRGLRQRTAIAMAIIHAPQVLLLDEPASGLDPEARIELGELLVKLRQRGISMIVSSHILAELEAYSTDILVLRNGEIVEQKSLEQNPTSHLFMLEVNGQVDTAIDLLRKLGASNINPSSPHELEFSASGDRDDQAALLKALVDHGLGVVQFSRHKPDLQASYLSAMRKQASP